MQAWALSQIVRIDLLELQRDDEGRSLETMLLACVSQIIHLRDPRGLVIQQRDSHFGDREGVYSFQRGRRYKISREKSDGLANGYNCTRISSLTVPY